MDQLAIPGKSTSSAGRANDVSRMPKSSSDGPIEVFYSFFLSDLQAIESVQQKMTVTFYYSLFWKDDRVWERDDDVKDDNAWNAYTFREDVNPADVWVPVMELANCGEGSLEEEMREINNIPGKGVFVTQHNVFKGTVDVSLDLKQFPFDYQNLNILIRVRDFGKSEIVLKSNEQQLKSLEKYIDKKINLPDWYFMSAVAKDGFHIYENLKEIQGEEAATYAQVDIRFEMQRKAGYYMNKVWLQFNIISAMNLFVFVLDDDDISNKNTISLTLFLTIVALAFTIVGELPKISYRTRLDNFILQQFVFNLFIYIVNFILYKTEPEGASGRIITLLILVGGFALMNVWFIIAHRIFRGQHMRRTLHQEYHDKLEGGPFLNLNLNMTTKPAHTAMSMRNLN